jgi:titin
VIAGGNSTVSGLVIQNFSTSYYDFFPGFELGPNVYGAGIELLSSGNTVAGDYTTNTPEGVLVDNGPNNTIGGSIPGARNVFGNGLGIAINGTNGSGNLLEGDYIGTDGSQLLSQGTGYSQGNGVIIEGGSSDNVIGGTSAGAGNVIAGGSFGVLIGGGGESGNLVEGNYIGLKADGTEVIPGLGIVGVSLGDGTGDIVGGTSPSARNVIAGWSDEQVILITPPKGLVERF